MSYVPSVVVTGIKQSLSSKGSEQGVILEPGAILQLYHLLFV